MRTCKKIRSKSLLPTVAMDPFEMLVNIEAFGFKQRGILLISEDSDFKT